VLYEIEEGDVKVAGIIFTALLVGGCSSADRNILFEVVNGLDSILNSNAEIYDGGEVKQATYGVVIKHELLAGKIREIVSNHGYDAVHHSSKRITIEGDQCELIRTTFKREDKVVILRTIKYIDSVEDRYVHKIISAPVSALSKESQEILKN